MADFQTQLFQLLCHSGAAIAAQAEPGLLLDMRQNNHVGPLPAAGRAAAISPQAAGADIDTTNAIESLNRVIRKSIKTRGSFPTDDAATKLIYLAIRKFEKDGRNVREWFAARNQFAIMFGERFDA